LSGVVSGATTVSPGPTSWITVAFASTVAPSCKVIGPIDHHRAGSDPDAIAQRGPAGGVVPDGDLLIDPAMAANGFRGDDGCDTVLDEEAGANPVGAEGKRFGRSYSVQGPRRQRSASTSRRARRGVGRFSRGRGQSVEADLVANGAVVMWLL
jgi:hypothetical protein